jgi:hypothetical protein
LQSIPCRVKTCPALAVSDPKQSALSNSFLYCPIHLSVAADGAKLDLARAGKMGPAMKAFAEDIDRGIYPKKVW